MKKLAMTLHTIQFSYKYQRDNLIKNIL